MTRGRLGIKIDGVLYISTEFNGDMMPDSLGKKAIKKLGKCETYEDFSKKLNKFNKKHFQYEFININRITDKEELKNLICNTDYTYIKSGDIILTFHYDNGNFNIL